mgnify:CR=1 FL=1
MNLRRHLTLAALALAGTAFLAGAGCGPAGNGGKGGGTDNGAPADNTSQPVAQAEVSLTPAEMERGKEIFFNRCAGCHGVLRKGATGKNLEPENTKVK